MRPHHWRTGTEIPGTAPLNSKSDGNSSPTEISSIQYPFWAAEGLKEPQIASKVSHRASKGLNGPQRASDGHRGWWEGLGGS